MAIYGIGAYYDDDVTEKFLDNNLVCIGWSKEDAPTMHRIFGTLEVGDIAYIKSFTPQRGLTIKAVGIIRSEVSTSDPHNELGTCLSIQWIWNGQDVVGKVNDKYNVRNNTIYEEHNYELKKRVLDKIFTTIENEKNT